MVDIKEGTAVLSSYETNHKLVGISPDRVKGMVHKLRPGKNLIGRGRENDLVIDSDRISKQHAIIIVEENIVIKDCESKNGTFINDKKISELKLKGGETVLIGDSEFMFIPNNYVYIPESSKQPASGMNVNLMIIGIVLMLSLSMYLMFNSFFHKSSSRHKEFHRESVQGEIINSKGFDDIYKNAIHLIEQKKWSEALIELWKLPADYHPSLPDKKHLCVIESSAKNQFEVFNQLLDQHKWTEIPEAIEKIDEESELKPKAKTLFEKTKKTWIQSQLQIATDFLSKKQINLAIETAKSVFAIEPENPDALALIKKVESSIEKPTPIVYKPRIKATPNQEKTRNPENLNTAIKLYLQGNWSEAKSAMEKAESMDESGTIVPEKILNQWSRAEDVYNLGDAYFQDKRLLDALTTFEQFIEFNNLMDPRNEGQLIKRLGPLVDLAVEFAEEEMHNDKNISAFNILKLAVRIQPGNEKINQILRQLEEVAKEEYRLGLGLESSSPDIAKQKWEYVTRITLPSNEYNMKAQKQLAKK